MSSREKELRYREALRYFENAEDILKSKARKKDRYYQDPKYVRMACATAYNGTLLALDTYFEMKGQPLVEKKKSRINVKDYQKALAQFDKKILNEFNTAYRILHLEGYYEGETNYQVINAGIESARQILGKIKPAGFFGTSLN
ncbi:MAG: DUF5618 family protein [Cyclobacteriaceae bacterium]|nr:DUF5618 family protein [Cyclobacteriaceae bacterium]